MNESNSLRGWLWLHNRFILSLILFGTLGWSFTTVSWTSGLVHDGGWATTVDLLVAMVTPSLSMELLWVGLTASLETLAYATAGISLAILLAFPLGLLASGTCFSHPWLSWASTGLFRGLLGFQRSIHELVWAWLFVAAIGLSPMAAVFALAIPYGGILGRIWADMLNDVRDQPLRSLEQSGASILQVLFLARLPQALPDLVSYTMFRFECAVRSAAIMSFIGLGGIGHQIELSLQDLHLHEAWTFIYFLIGLVVAVSLWSSELRRAMVSDE